MNHIRIKVGNRLIAFILLVVLLPGWSQAAPKYGTNAIQEAELRAHVEFLASDELQGRGMPGMGSEITQRYIATRFAEYGLQAFPNLDGYFQTVPLHVSKTDYDNSSISFVKGDSAFILSANNDFFFFPRGGSDMEVIGQLLFCGYGISAPEFGWDDFSDTDVEGKIVLAFNGEPTDNQGKPILNNGKRSRYANYLVKSRIVQEAGALCLILVQPPSPDVPPVEKTLGRYLRRMDEVLVQLIDEREWFPVIYIKRNILSSLLGDSFDEGEYHHDLNDSSTNAPAVMEGPVVGIDLRFKEEELCETSNVIGYWQGKSDETVVVMAHYDHEGIKNGELYPGADDNASGTAGLLGIARAFSAWGKKPQRGVVFLSSGAEEKGSLGAKHFLKNLPLALEKIVAVINMDMIGRDGSSQFRAMMDPTIPMEEDLLMAFYSGQTPELAQIALEENKKAKLNLVLEPVLNFHSGSDHVYFHQLNIPSIFLFTGFHSDYTSPQDTPDKILYGKLTRVVKLAFGMAYSLAQSKEAPTFDSSIKEVQRTGRRYGF
ncbi:hypothetical protein CEE37_03160 [candidate division LCP-89 bacterium B3_LCP]|uniref:Peptidase M28 domain-containing protein n=1 Tax=candidate division LCP-89 bacterium B3_LCP TaxID=2012998 RepID=A0A532V354_UNCL8|nr:MAG: hypothetical protein CEE37_03160 [candidate division LCP-89 bacterium B3_LCP]